MKAKKQERDCGNKYFFDLAVFLATSARGCIEEPQLYGSFRLIDALSRLIELPEYAKCLKEDPFLIQTKKMLDEKKFLVMSDVKGFTSFLEELVQEFAKELKRREMEEK